MTNLEEIEITIDPDGKTRVQVRGVPGPDCVALTAALEEKIGALSGERVKTAEFYDAPRTLRTVRLRSGSRK